MPILSLMDPLDAYRLAVADLGDAPADQLAAHLAGKFGIRVEPRFLPLFRATLRDQEGAVRHAGTPARPRLPSLSTGSRRFQEVRRLALALLRDHGLDGWSFAYNCRLQALGLCVYQRRAIELSIHFVARNSPAEIVDTILHEIAHALVGPGHGHDAVWKRKCLEIGARPERCGRADMPPGRWQARCGGCGRRFDRQRRPRCLRGWFCRHCGPDRGTLRWRRAA